MRRVPVFAVLLLVTNLAASHLAATVPDSPDTSTAAPAPARSMKE